MVLTGRGLSNRRAEVGTGSGERSVMSNEKGRSSLQLPFQAARPLNPSCSAAQWPQAVPDKRDPSARPMQAAQQGMRSHMLGRLPGPGVGTADGGSDWDCSRSRADPITRRRWLAWFDRRTLFEKSILWSGSQVRTPDGAWYSFAGAL